MVDGHEKDSGTAIPDGSASSLGAFDLRRRVGHGGMAEIWLAERRGVQGFNKPVAVKKILAARAEKKSYIEMFIGEAKLVSRLQHRNIVQIYELGAVAGTYYIAMEFVDGWDLLKLLKQCSHGRRPLPESLAIHLICEVLRGLDYAHNAKTQDGNDLNIVHFDVSPSNILLSKNGSVKLTDFGVARASMELGEGSASDRFRGKIAYMSPEQLDNRAVDRRSDIFSAGIVLYEILTLKRLFRAKSNDQTISNVRKADIEPRLHRHPEIAAPLKAVLRKALRKEPDERYATASEMADALADYLFESHVRVTDRQVAEFLRQVFERTPSAGFLKVDTQSGRTGHSGSGVGSTKRSDSTSPAYTDNGMFDAENALRVLCRLATQRASGKLSVSRDGARKTLYFARGRLVYTTSSLPSERIGQLLLSSGAVTERQLSMAKERVEIQGEKVGQALVALGALSFPDLHRWLDKQVETRFSEVFTWKQGHYSFSSDSMPDPDVPRLNIDVFSLSARVVESVFSSRWLASYFGRLGNPTLTPSESAPFPVENFRLAGRDLRLARQLLGRTASIRESLRRFAKADIEKRQVLQLLFLLHQTEHLVEKS